MKHLTHYAYHLVAKQVQLKDKVTIPEQDDDNYTLSSSEGMIEVTPVSCTCSSFVSMKLPCHHIFTIRSKLGFDLYDTSLCNRRWSVDYYWLINVYSEVRKLKIVRPALMSLISHQQQRNHFHRYTL